MPTIKVENMFEQDEEMERSDLEKSVTGVSSHDSLVIGKEGEIRERN